MKRWICLLLAICLAAPLAACAPSGDSAAPAPAEPPEAPAPEESAAAAPVTMDLERAGVSFDLPAELQNLKGVIQPDYGYELENGIYLAGLTYCAMTKTTHAELSAKGSDLSEAEIAYIKPRLIELVFVFCIDGGRSLEDLSKAMAPYGLRTEDYQFLRTVGEYSFFYQANPANVSELSSEYAFDEGFREEFESILPLFDHPDWIRVYEPRNTSVAEPGSVIRFETTDLDGNPVRSEDIFSENQITMINIWGTYCGPCIDEMPELELLNKRLGDKNCGIIGIVCDVRHRDDNVTIQTAKDIIKDTGVTYLNLIPWDGFDTALPAEFIPTTYFVDSGGTIVGEATVGAKGAKDYEALLNDAIIASE